MNIIPLLTLIVTIIGTILIIILIATLKSTIDAFMCLAVKFLVGDDHDRNEVIAMLRDLSDALPDLDLNEDGNDE